MRQIPTAHAADRTRCRPSIPDHRGSTPAVGPHSSRCAVAICGGKVCGRREPVSAGSIPQCHSAASTSIHGISDQMVAGKPGFVHAWGEIDSFRDGRVIVGHSIGFDLAVLEREAKLAGLAWEAPRGLCIRMLGQIANPTLPDQSLDTLAGWLEDPESRPPHRTGRCAGRARSSVALIRSCSHNAGIPQRWPRPSGRERVVLAVHRGPRGTPARRHSPGQKKPAGVAGGPNNRCGGSSGEGRPYALSPTRRARVDSSAPPHNGYVRRRTGDCAATRYSHLGGTPVSSLFFGTEWEERAAHVRSRLPTPSSPSAT